MNYVVWAQFVGNLASIIARENGAAPRELAYLGLLTSATTIAALTDSDLSELKAKYEGEVAADTPTTAADLEAIAARIAARSERIQGG